MKEVATMFWMVNFFMATFFPFFWRRRTYLRAASRDMSGVFPPVHTTFPEPKIKAVVLGYVKRMVAAANLCGL